MSESAVMKVSAVIMAAGRSSRFKSAQPKAVHPLLGKPMLQRVLATARSLTRVEEVVLVHAPWQKEAYKKVLNNGFDCDMPSGPCLWAEQAESLGTGHALQMALPLVREDYVLVLLADVPCIEKEVLENFVAKTMAHATFGVLSMHVADPVGYGRLIRDEVGGVQKIVETSDLTAQEKDICEVNTGIFCMPKDFLVSHLGKIVKNPQKGEYYLTDLVAHWNQSVQGRKRPPVLGECVQPSSIPWFQGVNTRMDLARLERYMGREKALELMRSGVRVEDNETLCASDDIIVGCDSVLEKGVRLYGRVRIGAECQIGLGCVLTDVVVGNGVVIKPYSVLEGCEIQDQVVVGPFAYLRKETVLEKASEVGCFVETKNTRMGKQSKAKHLAYLGDLQVGAQVNIGAGVIHCNYNGREKFVSCVEAHAFVGADSQLVGPVCIGQGALVAAGTTVTQDVAPKTLAIGRVEVTQKVLKVSTS